MAGVNLPIKELEEAAHFVSSLGNVRLLCEGVRGGEGIRVIREGTEDTQCDM